MGLVRIVVVNQLVDAALTGLCTNATDVTAAEIWSACMTLTYRMMRAAKSMGSDLEAFRPGILLMYLELPPERHIN